MMEDPIAFDSVLDLCRNQHRRIVLVALAGDQRSLTLDELTEAILESKHHTPPAEASETVRTEIRLLLQHSHVPKLADHSLVEYYPERQEVAPTSQFNRVEPHLSSIIDADPAIEAPATP